MLTWLALLTIAGLLVLILFRITSVFVALMLVPVAAPLVHRRRGPIAVVFLVAALAVLVNHPDLQAQRDRLAVHGNAAMMMVATVFAAGVFAGLLTKSGMLGALSGDLVRVLPDAMLRHLPVLMGWRQCP